MVKVQLPKQLPSRLTTLQKACPAAIFEANPAHCPAASRVGVAEGDHADPPGPADRPGVLRLPRRRSVPEPDRRPPGLRRDRRPRRHDVHQQRRASRARTFKTVPDVPVGTFELYLPRGPTLGAGRDTATSATASSSRCRPNSSRRTAR